MEPDKGKRIERPGETQKPKAGEGEYFEIRLTVAGKQFPMTVARKKEELYRKAEKEINQLVSEYGKRFRQFQLVDHLAMAAIAMAVSKADTERKRTLGDDVEMLATVDQLLDEYISGVE